MYKLFNTHEVESTSKILIPFTGLEPYNFISSDVTYIYLLPSARERKPTSKALTPLKEVLNRVPLVGLVSYFLN